RVEMGPPVPPALLPGPDDGVVRSTAPLELAQAPGTAVTRLRVKAYERLRPWASVEQDVTVNVRSVNRWPPRCLPALLVTQIPETTPVGTVLTTFTCTDPDSPGSALDYQLLSHSPPGPASLRLRDRVLEVPSPFPVTLLGAWDRKGARPRVNATLDCDTPGVCFQHAASILVLDRGQPLMTTEVPVLVTVTPVNEFSPACVPRTFHVREDAGPHTLLGFVVGADLDHPHDSTEYYLSGRPAVFAVDRLSGEVRLLGPLDYELQRLHRLAILLTDHSQDQDPTHRRSGSCTITIEVEDVNDHVPECEPPLQELTMHAPLGRSVEVTNVSCWVPQEPQRLAFSHSIVAGNSQSRFRLQGATLVHSELTLGAPWPDQPHTYELLIRVADAGPSGPHLSTTATVIVHLVPWRASTVATSTHRATGSGEAVAPFQVPSVVTHLLVTDTEAFWQPEPWFVVVLTVTGTLLLVALGWLLSRPLQGLAQVIQATSKPAQCLLPNRLAPFAYLYAWESIPQTQAEAQSLILYSCSYSAPVPREPRGPWRGSWRHQGWRCPSHPAVSQAWYVSLTSFMVGPKTAPEYSPAQPAPFPMAVYPCGSSYTSTVRVGEAGLCLLPWAGLNSAPSPFPQQHFDGRAQDSRTGRDYLFNTRTGARRWL
ncbi:hypothetical protein MC885_019633, partial [Smutsia gigantea]